MNIGNVYWSGTPFDPPIIPAWGLLFATGAQGAIGDDDLNYAWAVRTGDVPEPTTLLLLGLGLAGLGFARRRLH